MKIIVGNNIACMKKWAHVLWEQNFQRIKLITTQVLQKSYIKNVIWTKKWNKKERSGGILNEVLAAIEKILNYCLKTFNVH